MRDHWKKQHGREGGLPAAVKEQVTLPGEEALWVEKRAKALGWWKPQQHVSCKK